MNAVNGESYDCMREETNSCLGKMRGDMVVKPRNGYVKPTLAVCFPKCEAESRFTAPHLPLGFFSTMLPPQSARNIFLFSKNLAARGRTSARRVNHIVRWMERKCLSMKGEMGTASPATFFIFLDALKNEARGKIASATLYWIRLLSFWKAPAGSQNFWNIFIALARGPIFCRA